MKNLEARQREMLERKAATKAPQSALASVPVAPGGDDEVRRLRQRVTELEDRVLSLEEENKRLRKQKTVVVERRPEKTYQDTVQEQRHNFFKYSNVRRY